MITLIEARNYRCLHYVRQPMQAFHVLVGPNASGKTTFLDVVAFLGDLVSGGLEKAVRDRSQNFQDLCWGRESDGFELAIEVLIPDHFRALLSDQSFDTVRYEVSLGEEQYSGEYVIRSEKVLLLKAERHTESPQQVFRFPDLRAAPETILSIKGARNAKTVVNKVEGGNDNFYSEVYKESGKGWAPAFKLGPRKSALGNLPEDESKFPVTTWLKRLLTDGVQQFVLNSIVIRKACPPGQTRGFKPDGSNLPWVIDALRRKSGDSFRRWIEHLRTALPDLEDIDTIEREDDKHRYLVLCYQGGLRVPSWMASDGTLRLLALTLPAYLPDISGVYLIEEPENGIHPRAVETMFQSLSSVYDAQILMATHSPVIISMAEADTILCFAKTVEGAADIVLGGDHPALRSWHGETNLGVLFAGGVLG
ncbi:MAG: ATP-binding protein [Candidatus Hydrogenedentes bacterium]|nr:ATP-binding protein [Candidatus Hydrogenedentota bacterium]